MTFYTARPEDGPAAAGGGAAVILAEKPLPGGRVAQVTPLTFGRARLHVGPAGALWYSDEW